MAKEKYVYPKLPLSKWNYIFFRVRGSGLANCLFVYARAIAIAHKTGRKLIKPTWFNISIGPYLRHQSDKRHYLGLFKSTGEISGLKKLLTLLFGSNVNEAICDPTKKVVVTEDLGNYFENILEDHTVVSKYIINHISDEIKLPLSTKDFSNCIAVHVRLGDYSPEWRVPISWYVDKIKELSIENSKFLLFSDGKDEELRDILCLHNVERAFFGSAIADILAISKCKYVIASDSTFSGWGIYLGQVPCTFYKKHFGRILKDEQSEIVEMS